MINLNEEKINPYIVDFERLRDDSLNEIFLRAFGNLTKWFLKRVYGDKMLGALVGEGGEDVAPTDVKIIGRPEEVKSYAMALEAEKNHILLYNQYGPDHPRTAKAKAILDLKTKQFERATDIPWPIE